MKSTSIDTSRYFYLQIKTLQLCGMWFFIPHSVRSFRFWLNILVKILIGILTFIIPTGAQLMYVVNLIKLGKAEIQEVAAILNLAITEVQVHLRLLDLLLRRQKLKKTIDQLVTKNFQFHLKPQNLMIEKSYILSKNLFWVLFISSAIDIMVQVILVPGLQNFQVLPLKMHLIWLDVNDNKYFRYIYAYQILYKPIVLSTFIALQTFPWAAMLFTIGQLDVLTYNITNIDAIVTSFESERHYERNTAFKEIFKRCILHHKSIMKFINLIQETFSGQFTAIMCMDAAIICTTGVQILSIESPLRRIMDVTWVLAFLSIFICNLFIDCYFSNSVTTKSLHLSTVLYSCPWIELPKSVKKDLILFIARTQAPVVLTAAKFVPVSLETFTKIMNWTYKGAALMNQMKK